VRWERQTPLDDRILQPSGPIAKSGLIPRLRALRHRRG
jgi:hypothetical protein